MTQRICPNCKNILGSYDYFFCTNCSFELSNDLIVPREDVPRLIEVEETEESKISYSDKILPAAQKIFHLLNLKEVIVILFLAVLIGVPVYLWLSNFSRYLKTDVSTNLEAQPNIDDTKIIVSDMELKEHIFGSDSILEYVPYDVEAYIEGHDFKAFADMFGKYDEGYQPVFNKLMPLVSTHFGAYLTSKEGSPVWVVILFPYDQLIDGDLDLDEFSWLKYKKIESALVISTYDVFSEVENAKRKTAKSLSLNPQFTIYKNELPVSGKVFIAVFSDEGKNYLKNISNEDLPGVFEELLARYLSTGSDNAVVK